MTRLACCRSLIASLALPFAALSGLAGCAALDTKSSASLPVAMATLSSSVGYRERILPPPGAVAIISLQDTARADAPATVLAEQRIDIGGKGVPFDVTLTLPQDRLAAARAPGLRAVIRDADGRLLWTSDTRHPVAVDQAAQQLAPIMMVRVPEAQPAAWPGGAWRIESLAGTGIVDRSHAWLEFRPDGTVSGSTGCNGFSGTYQVEGATLRFGPLASTRKACVPALGDQEARMFALLTEVRAWRLARDGALLLMTADGRSLLTRR